MKRSSGLRVPGRTRPKNLSLDIEATKRGVEYSRRNNTTLSRLVSDLLLALPTPESTRDLTPAVRRLAGIAAGANIADGREPYREHLRRKYGVR